MPDVADYVAITDGALNIATGADIDKEVNFNLEPAVRLGQQSILQFFYVSSSNASNLTYRFSINGTEIRTINVTGNFFSTIHEVIGGGVLASGTNTLKAEIVGGSGSVSLSDIVLWVQRSTV